MEAPQFRLRGSVWLTPEVVLVGALLLVFAYLSVRSSFFLSEVNLSNIGRQAAVLAILAVGQTPIVIARGFDLTVGSMLGFTSVIGATVSIDHGVAAGLLALVLAGTIAGLVNGLLIARFGLSSIVVTLGGLTFYRGVAIWLTSGRSVTGLPSQFAQIGNGGVGPVPFTVILALIVVIAGIALLHTTRLGAFVYAIGANPRAAALSGVRVRTVFGSLFVISGLLAAIGGFVLTARVNVGQPYFGIGTELQVIAAVFIGGVSFYGGRGSLLGVIAGVILLVTIQDGLNLLGFSGFLQGLVSAVVLLGAILLQRILQTGGVEQE
jgi:ribose transport system permease protein